MTAHAELARPEQRITEAKRAERGAQQDLGTAERSVEAARDAVREAHDLGGRREAGEPNAVQGERGRRAGAACA
jgi:hypothetical protein